MAAVVLAAVVAGVGTLLLAPLWVNDEVIRYKMWQQHVESHSIQVNGYKVHYFEAKAPHREGELRQEQEPSDGKDLVLIHGLGSRGEDWSPMIPTLAAAGFHVYVPDLLGYGRSAKPDADYSISMEEQMIAEFMDALGLEDSDVGGWSMGGWVALKLTLDHPEMVDRLVVFDAAGIYFPPTFEASLFVPADSPGLAKLSRMLSPKPKPLPGFVSRAAIERLHQSGWIIERSVAAMEGGKDLLDFRLHEIHKPTLVVWGQRDDLIPVSVGEAMHRDIPDSSLLEIAGCGHLAPSECAKPVLQGTIAFLKAEPAMKGGERVVLGTPK
jgi:pimeloyl-ACP methyl ester carboxylesterase